MRWQGLACGAVEITYELEHMRPVTLSVTLKEPSAAADGIRPLVLAHLLPRIEGVVVELGLRAQALGKVAGKQLGLFEGRGRDQRLEQLARVLEGRMGGPVLHHVEWLAPGHLEERTFTLARV